MATVTEKFARPQVRQTQCFIGGEWVPAASGKTFETVHPATEEVVAEVAEGDKADIDAAVKAARSQFDGGEWSRMDARDRGILMSKFADLLEEEADELALIYEAKGLHPDAASAMAQRIVKNPETALDTLTREELGMSQDEVGNAWTAAITSFLLFALGAIFPILPWLFASGPVGIALSALFSGAGLFFLGAATSFYTGRGALFTGGRMLVFGLVAAAVP